MVVVGGLESEGELGSKYQGMVKSLSDGSVTLEYITVCNKYGQPLRAEEVLVSRLSRLPRYIAIIISVRPKAATPSCAAAVADASSLRAALHRRRRRHADRGAVGGRLVDRHDRGLHPDLRHGGASLSSAPLCYSLIPPLSQAFPQDFQDGGNTLVVTQSELLRPHWRAIDGVMVPETYGLPIEDEVVPETHALPMSPLMELAVMAVSMME